MTEKGKAFEKLLLEAIDEALNSLGESAKQSIYYHLKNKFKIAKKDIPSRLQDFISGLETIFGSGANFIEILIMRKLYEKVGQPIEWNEAKELVFSEYVAAVKENFLKREAIEKVKA